MISMRVWVMMVIMRMIMGVPICVVMVVMVMTVIMIVRMERGPRQVVLLAEFLVPT